MWLLEGKLIFSIPLSRGTPAAGCALTALAHFGLHGLLLMHTKGIIFSITSATGFGTDSEPRCKHVYVLLGSVRIGMEERVVTYAYDHACQLVATMLTKIHVKVGIQYPWRVYSIMWLLEGKLIFSIPLSPGTPAE